LSLRRVDARFLLPVPPRSAAVLGGLAEWQTGLEACGVKVQDSVEAGTAPPDLVVVPADLAEESLLASCPMAIVEGLLPARQAARAGRVALHYLSLPEPSRPEVLVPLFQRNALRYALESLRPPSRVWQHARNQAFSTVAPNLGAAWPRKRVLTVLSPQGLDPTPYPCAGLDCGAWVVLLGPPHAAGRVVFFLFTNGSTRPDRVLKFARLPGMDDLKSEVAVLGKLQALPASRALVKDRVPRVLSVRQVDEGISGLVESAMAGVRLVDLMRETRRQHGRLVEIVDEVGDWLIRIAEATRTEDAAIEARRRELWRSTSRKLNGLAAVEGDLSRLSSLPGVLEHGDLWCANVVLDKGRFAVLDWSEAELPGLPIIDGAYFLADALFRLDASADTPSARTQHFVRLFRGELTFSRVLGAWVTRAATSLGIPSEALGPLLTLGWATMGYRGRNANEPLAVSETYGSHNTHPVDDYLSAWMSDPQLGPRWSCLRP